MAGLKSLYRIISAFLSKPWVLLALCAFDCLFVFANLLKPMVVFGLLFLAANVVFLLFSPNRRRLQLLFFIYPMARVLKFPNIGTSFLTFLLPLFYLLVLVGYLLGPRRKITGNRIASIALFGVYVVMTLLVSLINLPGTSLSELASYYIYLVFPIWCFVFFDKEDKISGTWNVILALASSLFGMVTTVAFFYVVPNGTNLLAAAGVVVFNMGKGGIRISPLTDDPNYGVALITLLSALFFSAKKTKKEKIVGFPIVLVLLGLSLLTISKMFILCAAVLVLCLGIKIVLKIHSLAFAFSLVLLGIMAVLIFLATPIGNSVLVRFFGNGVFTLEQLTSGRAELFGEYSSYVLAHPLVLLFGKGPVFSDFSTFSSGEHNLFTRNLFGSGLVGVSLILLVLFLMVSDRLDERKKMPSGIFFYGFLVCFFLCAMSLSLAPSTVFPIVVLASQFLVYEDDTGKNRGKAEPKRINLETTIIDI